MRALLHLALGLAVSLACLYFATRGSDWGEVRDTLLAAHSGWVLAAALAVAGALLARAWRWLRLLRPVSGAVRFGAALSATAIGSAATAVVPLRLGELVRPVLLARRAGIGVTPVLATVVIERLVDLLFIVLCFLWLSFVYPLPAAVSAAARGLAVAGTAGLALLVLAQRHRATSERWLAAGLARLPARLAAAARPLVAGVLDGCKALADLRTVAVVCALSALIWASAALVFLCALLALGVAAPLLPAALASVVIVAAFIFLPQAPGYVGTWQAGCVLALDLFGVPQEQAVGYALLTWLLSMLVNVGAGGLFLARAGLTPRQVLGVRPADAGR